MPVCDSCLNWYLVPSRIQRLCKDCESKAIASAAKEVDSKAMSIASISSWVVFKRQPIKFKPAWSIE